MTAFACSIVIPSFNHRHFIGAAIDSVLAQTCGPLELIVIDDGSADGSAEFVRERYGHHIHRLAARDNRGAHAAINDGIAAATAPFVAILNSDDLFEPARVERMLAAMQDQGADLAFSDLRLVDGKGGDLLRDPIGYAEWSGAAHAEDWRGAMVERNLALTTSNFVIRRAAFDAIGPLRAFRYVHDWDFMLRALSRGQVIWVREQLCRYRLHGGNTMLEAGTGAGRGRLSAELAAMMTLFLNESRGTPMETRRGRVLRAPDLHPAELIALAGDMDRTGLPPLLAAIEEGRVAEMVDALIEGAGLASLRGVRGADIGAPSATTRLTGSGPVHDGGQPKAPRGPRLSSIAVLRGYLRARRAVTKHVGRGDITALEAVDAKLKEAERLLRRPRVTPATETARLPTRSRPATGQAGTPAGRPRALLVSNVGYAGGASLILLSIGRRLRRDFGLDVVTVLAGGGALEAAFAELGPVEVWPGTAPIAPGDPAPDPEGLRQRFLALLGTTAGTVAFCNTVVTAHCALALAALGVPVIGLVHEHAASYAERLFTDMFAAARRVVFPARLVRDAAAATQGFDAGRAVVLPQDIVFDRFGALDPREAREAVLVTLGLPPDARIVLGCGMPDLRKGFDLFVATLIAAAGSVRRHGAYFVWLGNHPALRTAHLRWLTRDLEAAGLRDRLILAPTVSAPEPYYHAAEIFLLPSREDPFPCVVQEAMACRLPVICFRGATGSQELVEQGAGCVVPAADTAAMAEALSGLLEDDARRSRLGEQARALAIPRFTQGAYAAALHGMMTDLLAGPEADALRPVLAGAG